MSSSSGDSEFESKKLKPGLIQKRDKSKKEVIFKKVMRASAKISWNLNASDSSWNPGMLLKKFS